MKARRSERLIPLEIRQEGHQNLLLHQPEQTIAETGVGEKDGEVETAEGEKVTSIEAAKRRDVGSEEDAIILGSYRVLDQVLTLETSRSYAQSRWP